MGRRFQRGSGGVEALIGLAFVAAVFAAWLTHVIVCLKTAAWGFLIAGAILFPIGIIHGFGIWFGAF